MALPHTAKVKGQSTYDVYWTRSGTVQKKPYTDVLDCTYVKGVILYGRSNVNVTITPDAVAYGPTAWNDSYSSQIARTGNKSRDGFSQLAQDRVNLAVDLAEYHQSVDMIAQRAKQLAGVVKAVRRKDFGMLLKNLDPRGQKAIRGKKPTWKKSFANNFLETHFGWVPLVQDIHDAAHVISQPLNAAKVVKSSSEQFSYENFNDAGHGFYNNVGGRGTVKTRVSAYVKCTNPALHLASSLGITSPLALAWELIPFSFVVDWFANVGQFVGQLDEFAGLELIRPCTTRFYSQTGWRDAGNPYWDPPRERYGWSNVCMQRSSGIPAVQLVSNKLKLPSATRAVTAVSLLIQQLGK